MKPETLMSSITADQSQSAPPATSGKAVIQPAWVRIVHWINAVASDISTISTVQ